MCDGIAVAYLSAWLEGEMKATKWLRENTWCAGQDSNHGLSKRK